MSEKLQASKESYKTIGKQLRVVRKTERYSQAELAGKAGVTRQTIGLIEAGRYNPSLKVCLNICHVLGKTLDEIFWVEEEK